MSTEVENMNLDQMKERFMHLRENAAAYGNKALAEMEELRKRMLVYGDDAREFLDATSEYIKQNPQRATMLAAGVGVAAGLILGLLIRR
ncbi:MAG: hypothetical protein HS115_02115 [Spirochaetales bacterium]|nr:hypothetical protein [Spirochaetales bacterium]